MEIVSFLLKNPFQIDGKSSHIDGKHPPLIPFHIEADYFPLRDLERFNGGSSNQS